MSIQEFVSQEQVGLGVYDALGLLDRELPRAKAAGSHVAVIKAAVSIPGLHNGSNRTDFESEVIRALGYRLASSVRRTDVTTYLGNREFLVVLPRVSTCEDAHRVADGLVRVLRHPISVASRIFRVGVNAGVAVSGTHGTRSERLMELASASVQEARKRPGKGTFMPQPKLTARMFEGLRRAQLEERTSARRAGDTRDWTGPRTER